jgi:hypothetical protein
MSYTASIRWVDNIRMDLVEVGWGGVDWICLAQDRDRWIALVKSVLNLRVTLNAGKPCVLTTGDISIVLISIELVS